MTVVPQQTKQFNPAVYIASSRPTKLLFLSPLTFQYILFFSILFKLEKLTGIIVVLFYLCSAFRCAQLASFPNSSRLLQCAVHRPLCKAIRIFLAIVCSFMDERSLFGRRVKAVKGNPFPAPLLILTYALHIVCIRRYTHFNGTVCAKIGDTHKVYFYNLMQPPSIMT